MFTHVDHIGFAVRNIDDAVAFYSEKFGVAEWDRIEVPERHTSVAVAWIGGQMLELIAPSSEQAAFAKYLAEKGPGMHHMAYRVDDIAAALAECKACGEACRDCAKACDALAA